MESNRQYPFFRSCDIESDYQETIKTLYRLKRFELAESMKNDRSAYYQGLLNTVEKPVDFTEVN